MARLVGPPGSCSGQQAQVTRSMRPSSSSRRAAIASSRPTSPTSNASSRTLDATSPSSPAEADPDRSLARGAHRLDEHLRDLGPRELTRWQLARAQHLSYSSPGECNVVVSGMRACARACHRLACLAVEGVLELQRDDVELA